jgi:uncharacterized membrane protein YhaH (DUF805 family)
MTSGDLDFLQPRPRRGLFSMHGRLGRARYISYSLGAIVLAFLFMYLAGLALMLSGQFGRMLYIVVSILLFYALLPIYFAVLTVRRAHDFNRGGWLALLLLVPVVNLMFWFIPGTPDENAYGAAPDDDPIGIKAAAVVLPVLLIGAFLATGGPQVYRQEKSPSASQPATSLKPYTP